jgi:OOP family OmpA-OmpF porin
LDFNILKLKTDTFFSSMYKPTLNQVTKFFSKRITFLTAGVLIGMSTSAQTTAIDSANYVQPFSKTSAFRTWSIGVNGGLLIPFNEDYTGSNYKQPGFGFYVKNQILSTVGLQADFFGGQAMGYNSYDNSLSKYRTRVVSGALSLNITLANINWRHKKGVLQPYFTGGYGYMGYQPVITNTAAPGNEVTSLYKQPGNGVVQSFFVPVGVGLKINVSNSISVDLGYTVSLINADDFDGLIFGTRNDEIAYMHAGLEFAIGNHKKPQLATHNPVNSMRTEYLKI